MTAKAIMAMPMILQSVAMALSADFLLKKPSRNGGSTSQTAAPRAKDMINDVIVR